MDEKSGERAVTPAVALVVMVVISIALAAVLGFVLFGGGGGGGGGQSGTPTANLTFEKGDGEISITIDDPGNTEEIRFTTTCNGSAPETITDPSAGASVTVSGCASGDSVTVIGVSGGTQKLLRKYDY